MRIHISQLCLILTALLSLSAAISPATYESANLPFDNCKMYVPNAFSPNGDGVNDFFNASTNCTLEEFEMKIFDRWGALLFQTNNTDQGWNGKYKGKEAESTAYVYFIRYKMAPQNDTQETFQEVMTGNFALLK